MIASTHDAGQEINLEGKTGYNVDLDRAGSGLADTIIRVLADTDHARALGNTGQRHWRENFHYGAFAALR